VRAIANITWKPDQERTLDPIVEEVDKGGHHPPRHIPRGDTSLDDVRNHGDGGLHDGDDPTEDVGGHPADGLQHPPDIVRILRPRLGEPLAGGDHTLHGAVDRGTEPPHLLVGVDEASDERRDRRPNRDRDSQRGDLCGGGDHRLRRNNPIRASRPVRIPIRTGL
jgi:hypothetical protein